MILGHCFSCDLALCHLDWESFPWSSRILLLSLALSKDPSLLTRPRKMPWFLRRAVGPDKRESTLSWNPLFQKLQKWESSDKNKC